MLRFQLVLEIIEKKIFRKCTETRRILLEGLQKLQAKFHT